MLLYRRCHLEYAQCPPTPLPQGSLQAHS